jgi:sugar phosphate isomerase/epimerase
MENRRKFLKAASCIAGATLLGSNTSWAAFLTEEPTAKKFGIQLYTLRDVINGREKETITALAKMGYTQIESYEGPHGMFWNMKPLEFKQFTADLGIELISSHCEIFNDFDQKVEQAAAVNMKYLICPWVGPQKSIDDYKRIAALFNEKAKQCAAQGIKFAYHNHDYSFKKINGVFPQDILMQETDPKLVCFEMDMYWVVAADENPLEWLKKYPGRFELSHIKDRSNSPINKENYESVDLGTGSIDFKQLIPQAKKFGLQYLFMEQEYYLGGSPIKAAEAGAAYLKKIKF